MINGSNYIFFNDYKDSIFIKTDAKPGDNWIMYESEIFTITADITKFDTISFLGVTDSAKFIEIKVFDTNQTLQMKMYMITTSEMSSTTIQQ